MKAKRLLFTVAIMVAVGLTAFKNDGGPSIIPVCSDEGCSLKYPFGWVPLYQQVTSFFMTLFDTQSWPARWNCGTWSPFHGYLYLISDGVIWLCYFAIPILLVFMLYKRDGKIPFKRVLLLFVAFILACGLTHLVDALIFYWPAYRLSAFLRAITAVVSVSTVFALTKVVPRALEFKDPDQLEKIVEARTNELVEVNKKLEDEIYLRRSAEAQAKALNSLLVNFKDAVFKISIISITNPQGIIVDVNQNFERVSGYSAKELIGQNHRIVNSGHHNKSFWIDMWKTVSSGGIWREEVRNKAKDGTFYWVDTFIIPIRDMQTGKVKEYLSIRNDITSRKESELKLIVRNDALVEQVIEGEERFNAALGQSPIGIALTGLDGRWLKVNKALCELLGYTEADLLKTNFDEITYPEDIALDQDYMDELLTGKLEVYKLEKRYVTKSKKVIWVQLHVSLLKDGNGHPLYFISQVLDIQERKKNEDLIRNMNADLRKLVDEKTHDLQVLNKELEAFSYSVSHDLRAPLRSIAGYAEVLREDYVQHLDEEGQRVLGVINKNANRMGMLIDDLLEFSRLGRNTLSKTEFDMSDMVKNVISDLVYLESGREVNFQVGTLIKVNVDIQMIKQVWQNLISNAIKYTGTRKVAQIEIGSKDGESEVVFFIKDNGVGFNEKYKHKLFGVFQRLHKMEEFEGTGVGLALVGRIINRHNGKVWVEATENLGATFYFSIPKYNKYE